MKFIHFLIALNVSFCTAAQDFEGKLAIFRREFKPFADSIAQEIEILRAVEIKSDTVRLFDIKELDKFLGFYIEHLYFRKSENLIKAIIINLQKEKSHFYFFNGEVIKAVKYEGKRKKKSIYYFTHVDNELEEAMIYRLIRTNPETSEYYKQLQIGKSLLKKSHSNP